MTGTGSSQSLVRIICTFELPLVYWASWRSVSPPKKQLTCTMLFAICS